jgi:YVTN family beta-propeller protein
MAPDHRGHRLISTIACSQPRDMTSGEKSGLGALPNWVTFTPDSKLIYISNSGIRSVSAIDTAAMKMVANIPVGEVPKRINTLVMR